MKTVKVLHLSSPGFGGVDSYIFSHYKFMDRKHFQFDFLTQNRQLEGAEQYKEFQYKVKLLPSPGQSKDVFVKKVREALEEGYDVLHLHTGYWKGIELEQIAKEMRVPKVIVHSHCSFIDVANHAERNALLLQHERIKRTFPADYATDFWACSNEAADWLFGPQIPRNKIRLMKNAIELERFQFDQEKRDYIRTELGLQDSLVLGAVGRISHSKNPEFLIDVFDKFHQKHKKSKLVIIGDGELKPDLEQRIQKKRLTDSVLLLGWKINVEDYLQAMDCFLMPSRSEALGIAALEAVASGLQCLVSDQAPEELEFTDHIRRVPLETDEWISALEETEQLPSDRHAGTEILCAAGYDIRQQAKILEGLYQE